ncbi:uroporphyrinogen decarboxylase [Granulibacter bethesdensis]|uniref:uroporphyrinogen decarboxylase n=1 Tax=Granulibacter bethesdensis TaxID=364410 RepID=UPI00090A0860|nr:uroporphyrinogen decarboxylase [Granulibacter bethesdensis]APH58281.1 Uroporphyrinogen decarboxylase [Granulibacter bethesdensis]
MNKPILRVLRGEALPVPPVWLMRQAGRYLPEYREVRAKAGSFLGLATHPEWAAEVTLQPIRRFGMDAAILFSDILMLPWALGYGLHFAEGEGPVLPKLEEADIDRLDFSQLIPRIAPIMETVTRVREQLQQLHPETTLIGFAGAPFTVSCYMVDGGGTKDFPRTRHFAYTNPEAFDRLIARLTEATITYLSAQVEAGAEVLMLFDSWAGLLSPLSFARWVTAPARQITAALKARYPSVPVIGFPRLAGTLLQNYASETGVNAVGMDTSVDPAMARKMVPAEIALQGNLDPLALHAGGEAMRREVSSIRQAMAGHPHIFNLGHGIVPQTSPEHVAELLNLIRKI